MKSEKTTKRNGAAALGTRSNVRIGATLALVALGLGAGVEVGRDFGVETTARVEAQTAAPGADVETLRESIGNFFENLSDPNKSPQKALEDFTKNSALALNEKALASLADSLKNVNANFGAYVAYESIGFKTFGSDLIVFRYLYKCQDHPVVWDFTFYRPRAKATDESASPWSLLGLRFETNLEKALQDAPF